MVRKIQYLLTLNGLATRRFFEEQYTYRASALAFTTLLAVVPLLSVFVFVTSFFSGFTQFIAIIQNYLFENFIPTSNAEIQYYLEGFVEKARSLPAISILFLFVTAIMLITTIVHTFNDIWHVPKLKKKVIARLVYWGTLMISPVFIGMGIILSSYLFSLHWITSAAIKLSPEIHILKIIPFLLNIIIFTTIYVVAPNCAVRFREGLLGGVSAAILFEVAKKGFAFYIHYFPSYELIYGVLAIIPIFLLWLYVSWVIVLFGALLTFAHYSNKHGKP